MKSLLAGLGQILLDTIFPPYCCHCGQFGSLVCAHCYEQITFYTLPTKLNLEPLYLDKVIVAGDYKGPLRSLVTTLKYKSVKNVAFLLGTIIYETLIIPKVNLVTAIPLHPKKQKTRGFNQAELIAKKVAKLLKVPYVPLLIKNTNTVAQASLSDRQERLTHLENAFSFNEKYNLNTLTKPHILLFDDVVTTGTTLNQAAKVLKENGAATVVAITIAHGV